MSRAQGDLIIAQARGVRMQEYVAHCREGTICQKRGLALPWTRCQGHGGRIICIYISLSLSVSFRALLFCPLSPDSRFFPQELRTSGQAPTGPIWLEPFAPAGERAALPDLRLTRNKQVCRSLLVDFHAGPIVKRLSQGQLVGLQTHRKSGSPKKPHSE